MDNLEPIKINSSVNERLIILQNQKKFSWVTLQKSLGVNKHQQVTNWIKEKDREDIPPKYIIKIIELFKDIDARWFITGESNTPHSPGIDVTSEPTPPYHTKCTSGECIKEIERLRTQIDDLIDDKQRLKIQLDEMSRRGGCSPGELKGGVEAPGKTG